MMIRQVTLIVIFFLSSATSICQQKSSSRILHDIKKLSVFGSVLYIAAHPDDENTRLLSYLANEKKYRTGYLSLTRGDGGQNLIGDEQGIDLGMIRTHELLEARKVDGAEQFFTRAYDFGYSKSPEEALKIWGHEKILSDVVWAIRTFRPDVIICRFPTTGEGGHGHHTASAILASEAFDAAADATRFPEQLSLGVSVWKAKRLLWNTFNFGSTNTQREDQFKLDAGLYNPLLGVSYGELAAESRSKHSSQGFGVPAQRGSSFEYFATIKGETPVMNLLDGVDVSASRIKFKNSSSEKLFKEKLSSIEANFNIQSPQESVTSLLELLEMVKDLPEQDDRSWKQRYASKITRIILDAAGLFMEVVSKKQMNVIGDSATFSANFVNRTGVNVSNVEFGFLNAHFTFATPPRNTLLTSSSTIIIPLSVPRGNPFWLHGGLPNGSFTVESQSERIAAVLNPHMASVKLKIEGQPLELSIPVQYKFTEPTRGEIYQPVYFIDAVNIAASPSLEISNLTGDQVQPAFELHFNKDVKGRVILTLKEEGGSRVILDSLLDVKSGRSLKVPFYVARGKGSGTRVYRAVLSGSAFSGAQEYSVKKISYHHIPELLYQYRDSIKIVSTDFKVNGKTIGYIKGAGDKVPEALRAMGYSVDFLSQEDITNENLRKYDAVVTGIRAFNVHEWLEVVQPVLMNYVKQGGVMLVQYNTNSNAGPLRTKISPYPFSISRLRITDENSPVKFIDPADPLLNYPNKITQEDFTGWVQERSVYHAEKLDPAFRNIIVMRDPGKSESDLEGSLVAANYGAGRYIYTGLSFFRQLPAGVAGAYRLLANLLAKPEQLK